MISPKISFLSSASKKIKPEKTKQKQQTHILKKNKYIYIYKHKPQPTPNPGILQHSVRSAPSPPFPTKCSPVLVLKSKVPKSTRKPTGFAGFCRKKKRMKPTCHRENRGKTLGMVPVVINPIYTPCIVGIYWVYPLLTPCQRGYTSSFMVGNSIVMCLISDGTFNNQPFSDQIRLMVLKSGDDHLGCIKPVINNGINYQRQLVLAGFQPSTELMGKKYVYHIYIIYDFMEVYKITVQAI